MHNLTLADRASEMLSLQRYGNADQNVDSWPMFKLGLHVPDDQYVLRMMIRSPHSNGFQIPEELRWLENAIFFALYTQEKLNKSSAYVYVTVRSGLVTSVTDDEWHVDGFSMRVPHEPEQNYVWTDCYPTQHLAQQFDIPKDFDPMRHNLHQFFQDRADASKIKELACERLHLIDPYIVHRRPTVPTGTRRTFVRISFVPIEIEDDTCTPNPLLPQRKYERADIRKTLIRY